MSAPRHPCSVRVLMMQRDEGPLLLSWFSHYARLFGMDRLTVMDNGSRDPLTLHVLAQAEARGALIDRRHSGPEDFQAKGLHFARVIRSWDADPGIAGTYDMALPVDCDEFIAAVDADRISTATEAVHDALAEVAHEKRALRLELSLFNVPDRPGWFAVDPDFCKGAIPAGGVDLIDNGQHMPNSALEPGFAATRLTYLHWHNRPFDEMRERARQKIGTSLIDPTDDSDLRRYAMVRQAPGRHLLPVLLRDAQWYRARYDDSLRLFVPEGAAPGGAALPGETGSPVIEDRRGRRTWSDTAYLAANSDVANYPLGPLHHFLRYGWAEGRLERPSA
ncbi:glycosyltransferase family 2 protein [Tanticharoenia sakaeratensis]|uniref:Glycosyl transferase family 2 n=1 Tax=Tanticharoenia sakaeratensis NBRC 103193 TaxID=1231623 RepID=A0A0D6MI69_9PROT|nr:glycosyltransferase family 2 protein [Tanticharoenia sakaeratensis]GAN52963.1 hypothetical protein Tasa_004_028 [Tanticharoenia sakaeratensis NBRC 103193]GBQ19922.1 hypothetical protein AA103193_1197 [Tanticharoenia sakaeratensis NBRC 103193]